MARDPYRILDDHDRLAAVAREIERRREASARIGPTNPQTVEDAVGVWHITRDVHYGGPVSIRHARVLDGPWLVLDVERGTAFARLADLFVSEEAARSALTIRLAAEAAHNTRIRNAAAWRARKKGNALP